MRVATDYTFNVGLKKFRSASVGSHPSVLTDIFDEEKNIVIWQRKLSAAVENQVQDFIDTHNNYRMSLVTGPDSVLSELTKTALVGFLTAVDKHCSLLVYNPTTLRFCLWCSRDTTFNRRADSERAQRRFGTSQTA